MNAGIVPNHMNAVVMNGVAPMLYVMKYESAALVMLMVTKAIIKNIDNKALRQAQGPHIRVP